MRPEGSGTIISGQMGMDTFVLIFMFIWLGIVFLIGGPIFLSSVGDMLTVSNGQKRNSLTALIPVGMFGFGLALLWFGRFLARSEAEFIARFLIVTLDGREV